MLLKSEPIYVTLKARMLKKNLNCDGLVEADGGGVAVVVGQERSEDSAACSGAGVASDPYVAAVTGDDAVGDPQAEAIAHVLLGGEEGVEDLGQGFERDTGAGVDETDDGPGMLAVAPVL